MAETVMVRISVDDLELARKLASDADRSMTWIVGSALRLYAQIDAAQRVTIAGPRGESHVRDLKPTIPQRRAAHKP